MIDSTDQQHFVNAVQQIDVYIFIEICLLEELTGIHHILLKECSTCELHHEGEHHLWILHNQQRGTISSKFGFAIPFEQGRFQSASHQTSYTQCHITKNSKEETHATRHRFVQHMPRLNVTEFMSNHCQHFLFIH